VLSRDADGPDAVARYGRHADQVIDVYLPPPQAEQHHLVVLLHGGFWRQAYDRRHVRPAADALRHTGYVVAVPEYRRIGGGGGWPATFDDIAALRDRLAALVHEAAPDRVSSQPPCLVGHSAGGHLALWWAATALPGLVRGVVALAPVADLRRAYAERLDTDAVAVLLGGSPEDHPDRYAAADPARLLHGGAYAGPITVLHGADDRQVPAAHSRDLSRVHRVELPGVEHFALIDPLSAAWRTLIGAVEATCAGQLDPSG